VLKGLPLLLDEKEARRPASSPQLLPATRSKRLLHLVCEIALPNTELLLTGDAPACVSSRVRRVNTGLRLVVPVCFFAEFPTGPVRLPTRSGSRIPIR
jgi:hypothetical protein